MSSYVQLNTLSSALEEQGTTVEKRMQGVLLDMYEALVPHETNGAGHRRL